MLRALEEPLRWIVANAGDEPSVVLNKVVEGKGNFGYNAQTGQYGDLMEMGVVDPTKVARCALQNAASVAGLILTTDAMVAELPKEEAVRHGGGRWHGWHGRYGYVTSARSANPIAVSTRTSIRVQFKQEAPLMRGFLFAANGGGHGIVNLLALVLPHHSLLRNWSSTSSSSAPAQPE